MENTFLPLIFRMRHINRWGLKHNTQKEDLMQHTAECAFITHYLAMIGNSYFGKTYNIDKLAVCALFHDCSEVLTGDLPTPIKYFNDEMKCIYKKVEKAASDKLKSHLPADFKNAYSTYIDGSGLSGDEKQIIKIADKLCAYIKCIHELNAGNKEFASAYDAIRSEIESFENKELAYFLENCLPGFSLPLDDLGGTL